MRDGWWCWLTARVQGCITRSWTVSRESWLRAVSRPSATNFPTCSSGGEERPDPTAILIATVRAAVAAAAEAASDLPLLGGGKSLGGRMTSLALSEDASAGQAEATAGVRGLVFFGFPLHTAGRPGTQRAEHLERVKVPMLFLQGTRDTLADLVLLRPLCATLAPRATLHIVDQADHSFHVLKRSGRTDAEVLGELARTVASWADSLA